MFSYNRCPREELWDRYILDASIPEHNDLTVHLENCPYCRMLVNELTGEWGAITARVVGDRASREPVVLSLVTEYWPELSQPTLAAMGTPVGSIGPEAVTMASDDRGIWLRAVRDPNSHEIWLYLYSEEGEPIARQAIVRPFGADQELLTDDHGRINLGDIAWPGKELLRAEVRMPKAVFRLAPVSVSSTSGDTTELTSPHGDRIRLSWIGDRANRRLQIDIASLRDLVPDTPIKVAVRSGAEGLPLTIRTIPPTGTADFEGLDNPESLEIYIYQ